MNPSPPATVFLVDDDAAMAKALSRLLSAEGFRVRTFHSGREFIEHCRPGDAGCLVLDVSMPGMDGLAVQEYLAQRGIDLPIVFVTGHGDIPSSVRAIKRGAIDFLTKPLDDKELLRAVRAGIERSRSLEEKRRQTAEFMVRLNRLTPREREVLQHVIAGKLNKQIAAELGTTEQTIKIHRMRVMGKMELQSVADLVRTAERLGISPAGH